MTTHKLDEMANRCGEWLRGSGPQSEIVISSRIRLARNLAAFPFIRRCTDSDRQAIEKTFKDAIAAIADWKDLLQVERRRPAHASIGSCSSSGSSSAASCRKRTGPAASIIDPQETFSLMINEEDHLRMQVMHSGLDLEPAWEQINRIDDLLAERVNYAFHEQFGYLTACPTNVGTGMRVSVMLHLPALVITQQIEKVFRSLQKMGLAVRGLYGEGSQAMGDFYQISNQITLGRSELDLVKQVGEVIPVIIDYERQARAFLVKESRKDLHDRVSRAYGILCTAQTISQRRDAAPAVQRADGRQSGADSGPGNSHDQQALHPHAARPPAKAPRHRAAQRRPQRRAGHVPADPPPQTRHQRRPRQR